MFLHKLEVVRTIILPRRINVISLDASNSQAHEKNVRSLQTPFTKSQRQMVKEFEVLR